MTSKGVFIKDRRSGVRKKPRTESPMPLMKDRAMAVCMALSTPSLSCLPMFLATTTLTPMDMPINKFTKRFVMLAVEPIAAMDV